MKAKKILNAMNFKIKGFTIGFLIGWIALLAIGIIVDIIALAVLSGIGCVLTVIDAFYAARDTANYAWSRAKKMSVTKSVFKRARNAIRNRIHKNKTAEAIRRAAEFDPHTF